jgi:hypothetical protein
MGGSFLGKAMLNAAHAKSFHDPVGQTKVPAPKKPSHFAFSQTHALGAVAIGADGRDPDHLPEYGNSRASMARGRQQVGRRDL